jgi:hypothetical protein
MGRLKCAHIKLLLTLISYFIKLYRLMQCITIFLINQLHDTFTSQDHFQAYSTWMNEPKIIGRFFIFLQKSRNDLPYFSTSGDKKWTVKLTRSISLARKKGSLLIPLFSLALADPQGTILPRLVEPSAEHHQRVERRMQAGEHILMPCVSHGFPVPESTWVSTFFYNTGSPRYMRPFYLQFWVYAIEKWPFFWNLFSNLW